MKRIFAAVGPAIIVASVVLGPGSILTSSKVGIEYGYQMLWVIAVASALMISMTTLGMLLGVSYDSTPCEEVARCKGRPAAMLIGVTLFVMVACFQSSNNVAVLAAFEGLFTRDQAESVDASRVTYEYRGAIALLILNGLIVAALYGFKSLYRPIELVMAALVLTMLVGFSINLWFAQPSPAAAASGLIPSLPQGARTGLLPVRTPTGITDPLWALQGLIATTLSIGGAFYQCYLVKEEGWSSADVRRGLVDSTFGIAVLGLLSAIVMCTSAAALHGRTNPDAITEVSDVAQQLEPLFGPSAQLLFSLGIFAAAFSSFLGNALIGGTVLSDALGLGASMDSRWPKRFTVAALLVGMFAAIAAMISDFSTVYVIVFAQALTVVGAPLVALVMLWLAARARKTRKASISRWVTSFAWLAAILTTLLALRTASRLYLEFTS